MTELLEQAIARLKALSADEQDAIAARLLAEMDEETAKSFAFHQALLASGLVKEIKQPSRDQPFERQLIQVQGKPVSETIVEERR